MIKEYIPLDDSALEEKLNIFLQNIPAAEHSLAAEGQEYIDQLTKPRGSLGQLEEMALALYCLGGGKRPLQIEPGILFTIAADHGVVAEGVSSAEQEVTRQMLENFLAGGAGVNALCKSSGMDFIAVDAGVKGAEFPAHKRLINCKIAQGTANIANGPAMSKRETLLALLLGIELANSAARRGCKCLAAGEMGIGNTTPSSALYCAWLKVSPADSVGAGAGLSDAQIAHKITVVQRALEANKQAVESERPLEVLAALGGLEIAAMAGVTLGAALNKTPMLIDGFIATAAFVAAWKLCPKVQHACFFAHSSAEKAHAEVLNRLGKKPMLDLGMRLGEGSGAALGFGILRGAASMFNNMASFSSAGVTPNNF